VDPEGGARRGPPPEVRDALALAVPRSPEAMRTLCRWVVPPPAVARWRELLGALLVFGLLIIGAVAASEWPVVLGSMMVVAGWRLAEHVWQRRELERVARYGDRLPATVDPVTGRIPVMTDGETVILTPPRVVEAGDPIEVLYLPTASRCIVVGAEAQVVVLRRRRKLPSARLLDR